MSVGDLQTLVPGCVEDKQITSTATTHILSTSDVERLVTKYLHGGTGRSHGEPTRVKDFGTRARFYVGSPDLTGSLWKEVSHLFGRTSPEAAGKMGDMLLLGKNYIFADELSLNVDLVSAANATRDILSDLAGGYLMDEDHPLYAKYQEREDIRKYLHNNVWLRELDYQPAN